MNEARPPASVVKHSLTIAGHRTSVSLEDAFWRGLAAIAARCEVSLAALVASIDDQRCNCNLSSAIRVHVLEDAVRRATRGPADPDA